MHTTKVRTPENTFVKKKSCQINQNSSFDRATSLMEREN